MALRHPKLKINISTGVVDSRTLFDLIRVKYAIKYCGIYTTEGSIAVYIHNDNRMSAKIIRQLLSGVVKILKIDRYSRVEGELCDDTGSLPKHGGHKKPKEKKNKVPQLPVPENNPPPSKKHRTSNLHERQPPISLPKPESTSSFVLNPATHTKHPDNFHPIWSSSNGFWAPYFWVGPSRSLTPSKRVQPTSRQLERLFYLQDNRCRLCDSQVFMGTYSNADVDHIVPLNLGGETTESNLQILCVCCHRRKTSLESRKIMVRMTEPDVVLENDVVYAVNSHVFFELDSVKPMDAKGSLNADPGMYRLFY